MIRVDVRAIQESAGRLSRLAGQVLSGLALEAAEHLAEEARVKTPVDTGVLQANWTAVETGPLTAEARNDVYYASFVEFDTRHWISHNIVPGQKFMHRAMDETEAVLPEMVKERVEEVVRRGFGG
ncbi:MAG: HK97 gp10 family phage protein [Oscillospiraceae bacterium]|nr:HK97 gp10 family phage protein [Oscillospiraceae bacterium]